MQASTLQWSLQLSIYRTSVWGHNRIIWISKTWRALLYFQNLESIVVGHYNFIEFLFEIELSPKILFLKLVFVSMVSQIFSLVLPWRWIFFFSIVYVSKNSDNIDQVPLPCLLKFPFRLWEANLTGHVVTLPPLFDCWEAKRKTWKNKRKPSLALVCIPEFNQPNSTLIYFWEN